MSREAVSPTRLPQPEIRDVTQHPEATRMFAEAGDAPARVGAQLECNAELQARLGELLRRAAPRAVVTCARGSSDHAATYARYLIETRLGLLTASASPSISSVYGVRQDLRHCLFLAISQSGQSPDLLAATSAARDAGAITAALVNVTDSPLARSVDHVVPLHAQAETSVAATKSYIASLSAAAQLIGAWAQDPGLTAALRKAPEQLAAAWQLDWSAALPVLRDAEHLLVLGRGLGLGLAQEAALKLKETCALHAEAFSAAEVRHGPMALLQGKVPALIFVQDDETRPGMIALARDLLAKGITVMLAGDTMPEAINLPSIAADPAIAPMLAVQSFYRLANAVSVARGLDPDQPAFLRKVTETH